jgi:uncharacterized membrane protein YqjE
MTKIKNFSGLALIIVVFLGAFSLGVDSVKALSCLPPQNIFIAAYEQNVFINGFVVEYRGTGNLCDTRPVVSDRAENLQSAFSYASQNLNQPISGGVYQLETQCWSETWEEWCAKETTLKQISDTASEMARYKSEWEQKERDELRAVTIQLWLMAAIIVAIAALAIVWPWLLIKIWPNVRRKITTFLIAAILLQVLLALIWQGIFIWSHDLCQTIASVSSVALVLAIVAEIIFIIIRKIRPGDMAA